MKLVSVVLPTYNGARYIRESIQSCLDQTYPTWELIIVDDASTDDTPHIAAGYATQDSRIRVIRHPANRKLPGALNTGFAQAQGDYLTWTSDDNLYRPDALATMAAFLDEHPEIDVVYTDYHTIDEAGAITGHVSVLEPHFLVYKSCVGPCFLSRRAVHERTGPYAEDLFLAEDYDFWLRVSARFRLCPLHTDLYLYRFHGQSLTDQQRPQVMQAREQTLLRNLPTLTWTRASDRAEAYLHLAALAREYAAPARARRYWLQALRHHPFLVLRRRVLAIVRRMMGPRAAQRVSEFYVRLKKQTRT